MNSCIRNKLIGKKKIFFSHIAQSQKRQKMSALLFISSGTTAEALTGIPRCEALTMAVQTASPGSHSPQHCFSMGTALAKLAAIQTILGPFWCLSYWLHLWRICFVLWRRMYSQSQPRCADDDKTAAWRPLLCVGVQSCLLLSTGTGREDVGVSLHCMLLSLHC